MKSILTIIFSFNVLLTFSQRVTYSDIISEDRKDPSYEVIGKIKNSIFVLKSAGWKNEALVFDDSMHLRKNIFFDFLPNRTLNVTGILMNNFFYLIYEYQKKNVMYCVCAKYNEMGEQVGAPVTIDTTDLSGLGDEKMYSVIQSENKQLCMIFKIQKNKSSLDFGTMLFNNNFSLLKRSYWSLEYNSRNDYYDNFQLDNNGHFVFCGIRNEFRRSSANVVFLIQKKAMEDAWQSRKVSIRDGYVDNPMLKVDNYNKKYLINAFCTSRKEGDVDGLFISSFSENIDSMEYAKCIPFDEDVRQAAKISGSNKAVLNDYNLRQTFLKKDGSFLLTAEYVITQSSYSNNSFYPRNSFWGSNSSYYYFNDPFYSGFYRPYNNLNQSNSQNVRYYYENILLMSVSAKGELSWTKAIPKQQVADDNDQYLSFYPFLNSEGIHFLYNDFGKQEKILLDNIITPSGEIRRNPSIKTYEKGIEFMPRFGKQIGQKQLILPASYRNRTIFAKIDY